MKHNSGGVDDTTNSSRHFLISKDFEFLSGFGQQCFPGLDFTGFPKFAPHLLCNFASYFGEPWEAHHFTQLCGCLGSEQLVD